MKDKMKDVIALLRLLTGKRFLLIQCSLSGKTNGYCYLGLAREECNKIQAVTNSQQYCFMHQASVFWKYHHLDPKIYIPIIEELLGDHTNGM